MKIKKPHKTKYTNLKSLKNFYMPYKSKIILFVIFTFLASAIALTYAYISSEIILNLTDEKFGRMAVFCLILLAVVIINSFFTQIRDYLYSKITNNLFFDIRKNLVGSMMGLKLSSVYDVGSGYFTERLNEDTKDVSTTQLDVYNQIIQLIVNLTFIFYISTLSWQIGLIFLAGLMVIVFLEYLRVSRLLRNKKLSKKAIEKVKLNENEIIKGLKEIKGINAKEPLLEKHSVINKNFTDIKYKREYYNKTIQNIIEIAKAVLNFVILVTAGLYFIPKGKIEIMGVLIIYNYKGNVYDLISGMAKLKDYFVNGELAAKRINDVIKAGTNLTDEFGTEELDEPIKLIEFNDVAFSYVEGKPILKDIDFTIKENSLVGFVGRSGSGKSTIFSLLTNFYKPNSGSIKINGIPYENLSESAIRNHISPVLQDPYIFNDTLKNNVRIAKHDATDNEIIEACKKAELHEEILLMAKGYETVIGENGANLSGGQKQRLEIARVLLKNTDVILFDEATSALDKDNLIKINNLLTKLRKEKIVLVIAHRLAIMRECDEVYVLDEGKMIDHGKHENLIEDSVYYQNLFKKNKSDK